MKNVSNKEIEKDIKYAVELKKKNIRYQNLWETVKVVLGSKYIKKEAITH